MAEAIREFRTDPATGAIINSASEHAGQVAVSLRMPGYEWSATADPERILDMLDLLPHLTEVSQGTGFGDVTMKYQAGEAHTIDVHKTVLIKRRRKHIAPR